MNTASPLRSLSFVAVAATTLMMGTVEVNAQTFLFDFGSSQQTFTDLNGNSWNNVTNAIGTTENALLSSIIDTTGGSSALQLRIVRAFNAENTDGTGGSLLYPVSATDDSLYGNTKIWQNKENVFPAFKLTGLDASKSYNFSFYASRMDVPSGQIRTTEYTITGGITGSTILNVANNVNNFATSFGITPDQDNQILIEMSPASDNNNEFNFTYLGVLKVEVVPEPSAALMLISGMGVLAARRRRAA